MPVVLHIAAFALLVGACGSATSVVVPSVVGGSEDYARGAIQALGLEFVVEHRTSDDEPPGTVIEQTPDAGTAMAAGSVVTVVIAQANDQPEPTTTTAPPVTTTRAPPETTTTTEVAPASTVAAAKPCELSDDEAILDQRGLRLADTFLEIGASAEVVLDYLTKCLGEPDADSEWYTATWESSSMWCKEPDFERYVTWGTAEEGLDVYFLDGGRLASNGPRFVGYSTTTRSINGVPIVTAEGVGTSDTMDEILARVPAAEVWETPWDSYEVSLGEPVMLSGEQMGGLSAYAESDGITYSLGLGPWCGE